MLIRVDLHHQLEIPSSDVDGIRLGTYILDTSNRYGGPTPWAALEYDRATVTLVGEPGPGALPLLLTAPPRTGARIWLEPWVLSPLGAGPLEVGRRLIHAFVARRRGDDAEFEQHERQSNARIAEFESTFGWEYLGVFKVHGVDSEMRADLYVIDAQDGAEAMRRADVEEPKDVAAIHTNAKVYVDPQARRYQLWMTPEWVSEATAMQLRLGDPAPSPR